MSEFGRREARSEGESRQPGRGDNPKRERFAKPASGSSTNKPGSGRHEDRSRQSERRAATGSKGTDRARGDRNGPRPGGSGTRGAGADRPGSSSEVASAPELPDDIAFSDLDEEARRELRTLPKDLADRIGRHLVAAGTFLDVDPEHALEHARYAKSKASRVPIVREAAGLAAYAAGEWSEALSELRAVRRMTRVDTHVAIIADAERALGRPERALDFAKEVDASRLSAEVKVELRIVAAGARRDLGQLDAAVVALQGTDLDPNSLQPWSARLFYAYADNLLAAGRREEALRWFLCAAESDDEDETDAAERASALHGD